MRPDAQKHLFFISLGLFAGITAYSQSLFSSTVTRVNTDTGSSISNQLDDRDAETIGIANSVLKRLSIVNIPRQGMTAGKRPITTSTHTNSNTSTTDSETPTPVMGYQGWQPVLAHQETRCPGTLKEWSEWRDSILIRPDSIRFLTIDLELLKTCATQADQISLFENPQFKACMKPLRDTEEMLMAFFREGKEQSLGNYFAPPEVKKGKDGNPINNIPEILKDSSLIKNLNKFSGRTDAAGKAQEETLFKETLKKLPGDWKAFSYQSKLVQHGGAALINITPEKTQILHYDQEDDGDILSITFHTKDSKGKAISPAEMYFDIISSDNAEPTTPNSVNQISGHKKAAASGKQLNRCIICHRAGAMPIVPTVDSIRSFSKDFTSSEILKWFNEKLIPQFANASLPNANTRNIKLPTLGEIDPEERSDQFMEACIAKSGLHIERNRVNAIHNAMDCSFCHNGAANGVSTISYLGEPNNFFGRSIDNLIINGVMPPKSTLSLDERKALIACLKDEYFGGFTSKYINALPNPGTFLRELSSIKCPNDTTRPQSISTQKKSTPLGGNPDSGSTSELDSGTVKPAN